MSERHPPQSSVPEEESAPRGREVYERSVRLELRLEDEGRLVVIDILYSVTAVDGEEKAAFARASEKANPGVRVVNAQDPTLRPNSNCM